MLMAHFQRIMTKCLSTQTSFTLIFVDDVLVYLKNLLAFQGAQALVLA